MGGGEAGAPARPLAPPAGWQNPGFSRWRKPPSSGLRGNGKGLFLIFNFFWGGGEMSLSTPVNVASAKKKKKGSF